MPEALTNDPRILNKLVNGFIGSVESNGTVLAFTAPNQGEGWAIIDIQGSTEKMFRYRGYIDLGGLEREALTWFMQNAQVTEQAPFTSAGPNFTITDVISKVEISDADLNLVTHTGGVYAPGYNDSVQDMDQVLWARQRSYYHDTGWTDASMMQQYHEQVWGEGLGTSASRLHLTRYIRSADSPELNVPGACFQCIGTAIEEPDLNYIMRLRRDYELATQG
jgi:hypothetical protein